MDDIGNDKNIHNNDLKKVPMRPKRRVRVRIDMIPVVDIAGARKAKPGIEIDDYSVRFSLENMNRYDEYLLNMEDTERRGK